MKAVRVAAHLRSGGRVRPHVRLVRNGGSDRFHIRYGDNNVGRAVLKRVRPPATGDSEDGDITLWDFEVDEDYQGRGIGTTALKELEHTYRGRGYKRMFIEEPTAAGLGIYEIAGYRFVPSSYEDGSVGSMIKRLR